MADANAVRFLEDVYARVDLQVRDIVRAMLPTVSVATQDDGSVMSNTHRILNFTGAGVEVTNDPSNRRTNVYVPGTPPSGGTTSTVTIKFTAATTRILDLWNGSSNDSPPANWETVGFNDSGWSHPGTVTGDGSVSYATSGDFRNLLHRHTEALTAGVIVSATLDYSFDDTNEGGAIWINGTAVSGTGLHDARGVAVPLDLLVAGGNNTIACECGNRSAINATMGAQVNLTIALSISAGSAETYVSVQDRKTSGTNGGTFTSGAWRTRTLNTEVSDLQGIASLASDRITLPVGSYRCLISAPGYNVSAHQTRLQNITASTTLLTGSSEFTSVSAQTRSVISGLFTLSVSSALEVQHQCSSTKTTDGLGGAAGFGTEVYTDVQIWKVG